jgi:hypothetical protein
MGAAAEKKHEGRGVLRNAEFTSAYAGRLRGLRLNQRPAGRAPRGGQDRASGEHGPVLSSRLTGGVVAR